MEMQVVVRSPEIPEKVREYAEKKLARLEHYLSLVNRAQVELSLEKTRSATDRALVQVTLNCNGSILRAQQRSADFFTSIDSAREVLYKQLKRYKAKLYRSENRPRKGFAPAATTAPEEPIEESEKARIVRRKRFAMKPMTPEEAIDEMALLGHDFFLFLNSETQQYNVVYRRSAGDYGLIEPEAL